MKKNLKSIGAVVVGLLVIGILSGVTSALLTATDVFHKGKIPFNGSVLLLAGLVAYQVVFYAIGCFATIKLAPSNPMKHVLILGALGAVLNLVSGLGIKDTGAFRFYLTLAIMSLLVAWLSGKLYSRKVAKAK